VLADRYAAIAYGSQNCIEGLQIVFQQNIAFWLRANHEIRQSVAIKQPIVNLYKALANDSLQDEFKKQLDEKMKSQTSAYDSHPAPQDRIAWIERLNIPYQPIENASSPTLELLPNLEQLQRLLTADLMKSIQR
jgi:Zn-dependent protease with chaperone function